MCCRRQGGSGEALGWSETGTEQENRKDRRAGATILNGKRSKQDDMTSKQKQLNKKVLVQMTLAHFKAK